MKIKSLLLLLILSACGCNKSAAPDPKLTAEIERLKERVWDLETQSAEHATNLFMFRELQRADGVMIEMIYEDVTNAQARLDNHAAVIFKDQIAADRNPSARLVQANPGRPATIPTKTGVDAITSKKLEDPYFKIEVTTSITDRTSGYWYWSYKLTARNLSSQPMEKFVELQFLNADGFQVASATPGRITVNANSSKTITDQTLIKAALSATIKKVIAVSD